MDERDNVAGFGGRSLDGSNPKYINSPESTYFQKRYLLYNLSNAKNISRKKNIGWRYDYSEVGYNYRLPGINSSLGISQLSKLSYLLRIKRKMGALKPDEKNSS